MVLYIERLDRPRDANAIEAITTELLDYVDLA